MADTISSGRPYIPNSDLPERFRLNAPLNPVDVSTFLARKSATPTPKWLEERGDLSVLKKIAPREQPDSEVMKPQPPPCPSVQSVTQTRQVPALERCVMELR
jgi:hypothetical protein